MRKVRATLLGIGITVSLVMISTSSASAGTEKMNCYKYPIGKICIVRGWDHSLNVPYMSGVYENTGVSTHTGHIDLYGWGLVYLQGSKHTVHPGDGFRTTDVSVIGNTDVRADWVDKNGTHYKSPTETAYAHG